MGSYNWNPQAVATRKHSSRIHTTPLQTVCASVVTTRCSWRGGPQMNKFEQVSSDGHQMSQAGGRVWGGGNVWYPGWTDLYSEVQCIMGNGHIWGAPPLTEWRTDTTENITFPQHRWRAVNIKAKYLKREYPARTVCQMWSNLLKCRDMYISLFAPNDSS